MLHEGGHFVVARWCKMRVERFSLGFGPTLIGFKRGDTVYQIAPIPLGGFVQITGLNPLEEFDHNDPNVYPNRPRWMRIATLAAGPAANYLTAMILVAFMTAVWGVARPTGATQVDGVIAGKPAEKAGMKAGDIIVSANGSPVDKDHPLMPLIQGSNGQPIEFQLRREGKPVTVTVTPVQDGGSYKVGVAYGTEHIRERAGAADVVREAFVYPYEKSAFILSSIGDMIRGKQPAEFAGPVEIARQMANAARMGTETFLGIIAILSVYLGLFNLLPIPALDGGRIAFLLVESVTRKRFNAKREALVHSVGFVLLLVALLLVTAKDILRLRG